MPTLTTDRPFRRRRFSLYNFVDFHPRLAVAIAVSLDAGLLAIAFKLGQAFA